MVKEDFMFFFLLRLFEKHERTISLSQKWYLELILSGVPSVLIARNI